MRFYLTFLVISLLSGCSSPPKTRTVEWSDRVDPRLLEQTDQPASDSMTERAKLYHTFDRSEAKCPLFVWCRLLAHGGYCARFNSKQGSVWVIHYFDSQGHIITTEKWIRD
jgi:hypothetical protein